MLRIIAGLDHADEGSIALGNQTVDGLLPRERDVAMVFQSYALYPYMTVAENIGLPLLMRRTRSWQRLPLIRAPASRRAAPPPARSPATCAAPPKRCRSRPSSTASPASFPAASASAWRWPAPWSRNPRVFLMDEPLSNLDAKLRVAARAEIAELHRRSAWPASTSRTTRSRP